MKAHIDESTYMKKLNAIRSLIMEDLDQLNDNIKRNLTTDIPLIQDVSEHFFKNQGKQIRSIIVFLINASFQPQSAQRVNLATIIEYLHLAMLLHDDVVDESNMRRGNLSANYQWTNATSILVGDFIYSRTFQLMLQIDNPLLLQILAKATNEIATGEVMQLTQRNNYNLTEETYDKIIYAKTAKLFETAAHTSLLLNEHDPLITKYIIAYGKHLGNAYQIVNDVLDYTGSIELMGRLTGDDLAKGNLTMPIIYILNNGNEQQKTWLQQNLKANRIHANNLQTKTSNSNNSFDNSDFLIQFKRLLQQTGSLDYCWQKINTQIELATQNLDKLPQSKYKNALYQLADFVASYSKIN